MVRELMTVALAVVITGAQPAPSGPGQAAPGQATIVGTIERMAPGGGRAGVQLQLSTDRSLPGVVEGDRVFRAVAREFKGGGEVAYFLIAFVERANGGVLYLDRNLDGRLSIDEGLESTAAASFLGQDLMLEVGSKRPGAPRFPFRCMLSKRDGQYFFDFTATFQVEGHVVIGGQRTLVSMPFNTGSDRGALRFGRIGLDANGDGTIDFSTFTNSESVWVDGGKPGLFRVRGHVVSVESVDLTAKTFAIRQHPPEAYKYVELRVGDLMPAFSFTDFEGQARKLADFRGRYVLLDFWGTWCGPCLAEFPTLRTARERFADRGFEILGIDYEKGGTLEHARAVVKERGVTWPNAAPASVKELVEDVLRITAFPSKILVGPDGRVVAFLGFDVVGGELLRRLDSLVR